MSAGTYCAEVRDTCGVVVLLAGARQPREQPPVWTDARGSPELSAALSHLPATVPHATVEFVDAISQQCLGRPLAPVYAELSVRDLLLGSGQPDAPLGALQQPWCATLPGGRLLP